jgi:hypothetical protein
MDKNPLFLQTFQGALVCLAYIMAAIGMVNIVRAVVRFLKKDYPPGRRRVYSILLLAPAAAATFAFSRSLAFAVIMTSDNTKVLYLELGATIVLIVAELWLSFLAIRMGPKAIRGMLIAWVISLAARADRLFQALSVSCTLRANDLQRPSQKDS